jgi:DNA-binding GntR family transcriptional regulator
MREIPGSPIFALLPQRRAGELSIQTAPQAAAQALREAIISGELKGGDRILEQKWSSRLGIGQPTLREAMKELENQGLLQKTRQRGTYVAALSPDDYRRILEVRIPLEAIAISRAAKRLTPASEKELTAIVMTMAGTGTELQADLKKFHDCDVLFHRKIWELADNEYLALLLETITFRLFVFSVAGRWPDSPEAAAERIAAVQQHIGILEGIRSGNPQKAQQAFVHHTVQYWNKTYGLDLIEEKVVEGLWLAAA